MHESCSLHLAQSNDVEDITDLETASFPADEAASRETIEYRLASAGKYFYSYRNLALNNELVGFVNGTCIADDCICHESMTNHDKSGRCLVVHSVTIKSTYRRHGLGTTMLKAYVQKMIGEASIDCILLLSKANMVPFYLACGFQVVRLSGVEHGQVCMPYKISNLVVKTALVRLQYSLRTRRRICFLTGQVV